jgi:hypothetical protein
MPHISFWAATGPNTTFTAAQIVELTFELRERGERVVVVHASRSSRGTGSWIWDLPDFSTLTYRAPAAQIR